MSAWVELTPKIDVKVEVELYSGKFGIGWYNGENWTVITNDDELFVEVRVRAWRYIEDGTRAGGGNEAH